MLRRTVRLLFLVGVLGAVAAVVRRVLAPAEAMAPSVPPLPREQWPPLQPDAGGAEAPLGRLHPDPDAPAPSPNGHATPAWVEPEGDACPATHPVKAKMASKIFHVPGGLSYERTKPDRCYRDPAAAEADGLRAAKR